MDLNQSPSASCFAFPLQAQYPVTKLVNQLMPNFPPASASPTPVDAGAHAGRRATEFNVGAAADAHAPKSASTSIASAGTAIELLPSKKPNKTRADIFTPLGRALPSIS